MYFIWDNLAAGLIALVLVVLLIGMQFRVSQVSNDRTALYAAKKHTLELADFVSRELSNVGSNLPEGQRITKRTVNAYGLTDTLEFGRLNSTGDTLRLAYILTADDSVAIGDTTVTLYRMQRYENGVEDGGSTPSLRDFQIELLDADGVAVGTRYDDTRQIRISLSSLVPFGDPEDHYVPQTFWGTTLRPNTLR